MKRSLAFAATSALMLGVLATAQPAYADKTLNVSVNLIDCSTSNATVTLVPGETLTINVTETGTPPGPPDCRWLLVSERRVQGLPDDLLTGWSINGVDRSTQSQVGQSFPGGPFTLTFIAGSVSAQLQFLNFNDSPPSVQGTILLPVGGSGPPAGTGAVAPPVEYTLGFNANGGTCTLTGSGPIVDGVWTQVPTAQQCTRPGYTLLGWNPRADGGDPLGFDPGGWTVMTGDNTLYAIWVPIR